jgi:hypothetical protein
LCGGSRQRRNGWRQRFFGGKSLQTHLRGLDSTVGSRNRGPGPGHLGKIGLMGWRHGSIPPPFRNRLIVVESMCGAWQCSQRHGVGCWKSGGADNFGGPALRADLSPAP